MKVVAAILAAGSGNRFGGDKTMASLGGKPVWRWSFDALSSHHSIDQVFLVGSAENLPSLPAGSILGGSTRQESSRLALEACPAGTDVLLIHDAARPFVTSAIVDSVLAGVEKAGAAAAAIPVTDTIKDLSDGVKTLERQSLVAMQTPQAARIELLRRAHANAENCMTDEMALIECLGITPEITMGDVNNFKITTPEDLHRARALVGSGETRTGIGYDIHPFSDDPSRVLYLGGVAFPDHKALDGHSDADVLLHAATDALLGAASMGDIGEHFPNTDPQWKGEGSLTFLRHAGSLLSAAGWRIVNLDITAIAETPKIMKKSLEIRIAISSTLGIEVERVSVKATTNERLGSIGRGEGIASFAVATIQRL